MNTYAEVNKVCELGCGYDKTITVELSLERANLAQEELEHIFDEHRFKQKIKFSSHNHPTTLTKRIVHEP